MIFSTGMLANVVLGLAALAAICGAGHLAARLLRVEQSGSNQRRPALANGRPPAWGWSYLLGLTLVAITLQLPLAIYGRISGGWFYSVLLVCVLISALELGLRFRRRCASTSSNDSAISGPRILAHTWIGDLPVVIRLFALMYVAVFLWFAAVKPCITFDARSIFGLKARMFDDGVSLQSEDFRDPDLLNFNVNYPLFVPVVEATLFRARGSQDPIGLQLLFAGFVLATASIIADEVRRFDSPLAAALWAAAFVLMPMTLSPVEGGGLSGSVDYAFAAYATAAVIATGRLLAEPGWRAALLAGVCWGSLLLVKLEGQIWFVAGGLAIGGLLILRRRLIAWNQFARCAWAVVPALGCAAVAIVNRRGIPESPYFRSFGQALQVEWLAHVWRRPLFLAQFILRGFTSPRSFGYCWQLVALALLFLRRPRVRVGVLFWRLMAAAVIVGYLLILTITPLHFEYQLRTALFRLAVHFLPLVLLIGAEQLAAAGWTKQLQSIFESDEPGDAPLNSRTVINQAIELALDDTLRSPHLLPDKQSETVRAA